MSNSLSQPAMFIQGNRSHRSQRYPDVIASVTALACANQSAFSDEIGEIARRRRRCDPGDVDIFTGAQFALKTLGAFAQHPKQGLFLPIVELAPQPVKQAGLLMRNSTSATARRSASIAVAAN